MFANSLLSPISAYKLYLRYWDFLTITVRLPRSLEAELRQYAGDALAPWIREAIAEKIEREKR